MHPPFVTGVIIIIIIAVYNMHKRNIRARRVVSIYYARDRRTIVIFIEYGPRSAGIVALFATSDY